MLPFVFDAFEEFLEAGITADFAVPFMSLGLGVLAVGSGLWGRVV